MLYKSWFSMLVDEIPGEFVDVECYVFTVCLQAGPFTVMFDGTYSTFYKGMAKNIIDGSTLTWLGVTVYYFAGNKSLLARLLRREYVHKSKQIILRNRAP